MGPNPNSESLADRFTFGDREHLALRMVPCIARQDAPFVLTPDENHFADQDEEPQPHDMRVAAKAYLAAGYQIVPLLPGTKKITDDGWQNRFYSIDDVKADSNLGLKCRPTVVDIDCSLALQCADDFLLRTDRIDGRPGKPRSHRAFDTDLESKQFKDIDTTYSPQVMLIEILHGQGKQVVVPPSLHESGERRAWADGSVAGPPPATVDAPLLRTRVTHIATVTLIARHWPKKGIRRELRLAYARALLETLKLNADDARRILEWACRLGGSDDNGIKHAASAVRDTKEALDKGEHAIGAPTVAKLLPEGEKLIARLREWYAVPEATARLLTLQPASEIPMRRAVYLWDQRLPVGTLALLAGREGFGKSLLSQTVAAQLTRGRLKGCYEGQPKGVIVVATEDAWEFVIVPRLAAAGADLTRCFRVNVTNIKYGPVEVSLPEDLPALKPLIVQGNVALLSLDPIISRLGRKLDTHVDAEVRQALEPLRAFAEGLRLSVLGIIHPNKSQAGIPTDPLNAIMGSRAFSAVSRSTLFVQADPDDTRLYLLHIKNNVGPVAPTIEFSIRDAVAGFDDTREEVHAPQVNWLGERDSHERWQTLLHDLRRKEQSTNAPDSARDVAMEFLALYLTTDPVEAPTVIKAANEAGIVKRTLQRAAEDLGVLKSWSQDRPPKMLWSLPAKKESEI